MQINNNYTNEDDFVNRVIEEASLPRSKRDGQNYVDIHGIMTGSRNRYKFHAWFNNNKSFDSRRVVYDELIFLDFDDKVAPELTDYIESLVRKIESHRDHISARHVKVEGDRILVPSLQYLVETQGLLSTQRQIV